MWLLIAVLFVLWVIGGLGRIGGGLIHLLLVIILVLVILKLVGRNDL